jgi:Tol biopolymer transport system component
VQLPFPATPRRPALFALLAAALGIAAALLLGAASLARATPPGQNGLISFREYFNPDHTNGALFVINPDGSHRTQITFPKPDELDTNQNWSPNGKQIVYEHDTPDVSTLWTINADGSNPQQVFPCLGNDACLGISNPSWSPDGNWLAFSMARGPIVNDNPSDVTIWAIRPNGQDLHQITHPTGFQQSFDDSPQWSPDSRRIAFQRNAAPLFKTEVWTADATTGGNLVRVSPPGVNGGDHPDYSPDGKWIMFRSDNGVPGSPKLMIAHPNGTGLRILLDGANTRSFLSSSFSPDGTEMTVGILPGVGPDGNADLWIGHFDSHERIDSLTPLTRTPEWESSPRWGTAPLLH